MRTLATYPYLNLYLHEGPTPVLELQWLSYVNSTDFRAATTQALALTHAHHIKAWLADDRLLGAVRPRDLDWAEQAILLPLHKAGLLRLAHLEAHDALNRHTISGLYIRIEPRVGFAIRHFEELPAARAWASGG